MEDLLFVAATLASFGIGLAYVRLCDRIIGPDPTETAADTSPPAVARERAEASR